MHLSRQTERCRSLDVHSFAAWPQSTLLWQFVCTSSSCVYSSVALKMVLIRRKISQALLDLLSSFRCAGKEPPKPLFDSKALKGPSLRSYGSAVEHIVPVAPTRKKFWRPISTGCSQEQREVADNNNGQGTNPKCHCLLITDRDIKQDLWERTRVHSATTRSSN